MVTILVEPMTPQPAQLKGLTATTFIMYVLQACCLAVHLSLKASLGLLGAAGQLAAQAYTSARNEQMLTAESSHAEADASCNALPPTAKCARTTSTSAGQPEARPAAQSGPRNALPPTAESARTTSTSAGQPEACPATQSGPRVALVGGRSQAATRLGEPPAQGGRPTLLTLNVSGAYATPDPHDSDDDDDYAGLYFDSEGNIVDEDGDILQEYASSESEDDDDDTNVYFDSVGNTVDEVGDILQPASDSDDEQNN